MFPNRLCFEIFVGAYRDIQRVRSNDSIKHTDWESANLAGFLKCGIPKFRLDVNPQPRDRVAVRDLQAVDVAHRA